MAWALPAEWICTDRRLRMDRPGSPEKRRDSAPARRGRIWSTPAGRSSAAGWWMSAVVGVEAVLALSVRLPCVFGQEPWVSFEGQGFLPALAATLLAPVAALAAWLFVWQQRCEQLRASRTADLMDTASRVSREWLWAVGADGRFMFSSPTSRELLGYEPSELLGQPQPVHPPKGFDQLRLCQ